MRFIKILLLVVGLSFLVIACGGDGGGGDSEVTISGTVIDAYGVPISGAQITISSDPIRVITDSNGNFSANVAVGEHEIEIQLGTFITYRTFICYEGEHLELGNIEAGHPLSVKDFFGTYRAEIIGDWSWNVDFIVNETPYIEKYEVSGTFDIFFNDWYGNLAKNEYSDLQKIESDKYVMYFDFNLPTYIDSVYIGDKRQEIWVYIDILELEKGNREATYKHINDFTGVTEGELIMMKKVDEI